MSYLIVDNNLADLESVYQARINLGLGNMSSMSSNDVLIKGGSISTSNFQFRPLSNLNVRESNYYMTSVDKIGTVQWHALPSFSWLMSNQNEVAISGFSNDAGYFTEDSLSKVALSGDFGDLSNVPQSLSDIYRDDILSKFMMIESNLSDIENVVLARENLGVGSLASQNSEQVKISNLRVETSLRLPENTGGGILYVDSLSNIRTIESFDLATNDIPGLVYTCNINVSNSNSVPTSALLSKVYSNILQDVNYLNLQTVDHVIDLVSGSSDHLCRSNNLSEYSNDHDRAAVKSNLRLGTICDQDSDNIVIHNLHVNSLQLQSSEPGKILSFDEQNNSMMTNLSDLAPASDSNPGTVFTLQDYINYQPDDNAGLTVLTAIGFSNYISMFNSQLSTIQSSSVFDTQSSDEYVKRSANFGDLIDKSQAKSNLGLSKVASTGKYGDLIDKPYALSKFENDVGFLVVNSNLADLPDKIQARLNLGLGSMATQDVRDVRIKGGYVRFKKLEIKREFFYKDDENSPNGKILVCADANGKMEWRNIPNASFSTYGLVKISDHVKINDTRTDVVPTCKTFSIIENNITNKLDLAFQRYIGSETFFSKSHSIIQDKNEEIANLKVRITELEGRIFELENQN